MKQITAIIIVLAMIFLCGCTGGKSESNTTEATTAEPLIKTEKTNASETYFPYTLSDIEQDETFFYSKEITVDPADPYSAFIKKSCEEKAKVWQEVAKEDGNTTRSFYYHITSQQDFYYFLYDINGDGTNELLLGSWHRLGNDIDASDSPMKICISSIYTLKNGKIIKIDSRGWWGKDLIQDRILYSNGKIVETFGYEDRPSYFISRIADDKLAVDCYVMHTEEAVYVEIVDIDKWEDKEISQKEYYSIFNQFCGDAKPVEIDWKRIDEYGM